MSLCSASHFIYCNAEYHYAECHYAQRRILFIVMLNIIMLNVVMLSVMAPFNLVLANRQNGTGNLEKTAKLILK
jgi:hypothetical protein